MLFSIFNQLPNQRATPWKVSDTTLVEQLNLKKVEICTQTGDLYQSYCEGKGETWFIPGVSPIKVSNIHRKIPINIETGLRSCSHQYGKTEFKVYEFWPSDFLRIFRQAGLSLKTPPAFEKQCALSELSSSGKKPIITAPQKTVEYVIRLGREKDRQIPFKAITDPDVKKLHWFVGQRYIGSSQPSKALFWNAKPGRFNVRAVDDSGRASSVGIVVTQTQ